MPALAPLHLRVRSDTAQLRPVREAMEAFAREAEFDETAVGEIGLCVNEAMANIIRHAYRGKRDQPIEIDALIDRRRVLRIRIRDWGSGNVPKSLPSENADPLQPGGLGLLCMGRLMDKVSFTPQNDGMLLEMKKMVRKA